MFNYKYLRVNLKHVTHIKNADVWSVYILHRGGGVLRKYLYGDAQSRLQNVDHLYTCVLKKKKPNKQTNKQKNARSLSPDYTSLVAKPIHLYTIFTEMMTHYYHFHQQNSSSSYHHRNKGSLIYLEQFQNQPIGIPKLMKMHLKTFKHPRTPCFRENPPRYYTRLCLKAKHMTCLKSVTAGRLGTKHFRFTMWFVYIRNKNTTVLSAKSNKVQLRTF